MGLAVFYGFRSLVVGLNLGDDDVYFAGGASGLGNSGGNSVPKVLGQLHNRHCQVDSNFHLHFAEPILLTDSRR